MQGMSGKKREQAKFNVKRMREQNQQLKSGLEAVYLRDEKRSLFLAADQWTDAFFGLCKPFS